MGEAVVKKSICFAGLFIFGSIFPASAQPFTLAVTHKHFRGHCTGKLTISEDGIQYATEYVKHQRKWSYLDLKRIEIVSRNELNVETYEDKKHFLGADIEFKFKVVEGEITAEIYQFLLAKTTRPLITAVPFATGESFAFTIPVKHRHFRGGCQGELKIGENQVVYETSYPEHSRIWLYKDIETIGLADPYNFRLTTVLETYTFDLKTAMTAEQYDFLWYR